MHDIDSDRCEEGVAQDKRDWGENGDVLDWKMVSGMWEIRG